MNPYRDIYEALYRVIRTDVALSSILDLKPMPLFDGNDAGVARREIGADEPTDPKLRVALVPLGGKLENISSSTTRCTESYALRTVHGSITLPQSLDLKWLLLKAIWKNRSLGLDWVENVDVGSITDEAEIGTGADSVAWDVTVVIVVKFLLNRTQLPMA